MNHSIKIGCIGCGTMGGAIVKALAKHFEPANISVSAHQAENAQAFSQTLNCVACAQNRTVVENSDIVFFAVKPAQIASVLQEILPACNAHKLFVSMAAGIKLETLSAYTKDAPHMPHWFRIMPNLPAVYGQAMTALSANLDATEDETKLIKKLLETAGKVEAVPEKLMDGVTAISGSGPAYAFLFIEALADAAVQFGIPRSQAYVYAAQTLKGAATMALEDSRSISQLKDAVCSPAGTTIDAVASLERNGFRGTVIEAANAAFRKAQELSRR
ncbi:MAG: pyrroline-5-carboxylate reductase [Treponema sp.]|nr:pyrroline-5-carboxylate reductase [Treponema sp.]